MRNPFWARLEAKGLLSIRECSRRSGMATATLAAAIDRGEISTEVHAGHVLVRLDSLRTWSGEAWPGPF